MLDSIFETELRHLMLVSYVVLGNNAVTNRYIEKVYGMPVHAWSTLFAISMFPGIRAKDIKQLFPRPQNTISRAASLLDARGLIRQETSPTDAREKRLYITDKGAELLAAVRATSLERQEELFAPLDDAERETFFRLARKIADGPQLLTSRAMDPASAETRERRDASA
jgi:DNA-binding MarR family transcriptional regulator